MEAREPDPVKLVAGILYSDPERLDRCRDLLRIRFGPMDFQSKVFPFDVTDYYVPEMGSPIFRLFVSFERLVHARDLAKIKIETNGIESELSKDGRRRVNIDPGIMDCDKVVLASAKYNGQKIYLDLGIWADLTLHYTKGRFEPYPWSFPDFQKGLYETVFLDIRQLFKKQRKKDLDKHGKSC